MKKSNIISAVSVILLAVFGFYDVQFRFEFERAGERLIPDPEVEAAYRSCYQSRDDEIHDIAFGTIDNPDVQKEYISSNQAIAARMCREQHPQAMMTERTPLSFNIIDLEARFW